MANRSITVEAPVHGWSDAPEIEPRFAAMVDRLERLAERAPAGYRFRVAVAGLMGYGVLAGVLSLVAGASLVLVVLGFYYRVAVVFDIKIALILGATSLALLRALWIPPAVPDGMGLEEQDAPRLFAFVRQIAAAAGGVRIDEIRITGDFNAAITQEVRMALFGGRNRLFLGLPLLLALEPREVEAVVAHEFGHFAAKHGHWAAFAYRVRLRWSQVAERLPSGIVSGALRRFFAWYGPWFAAYSFVLARQQEYEADRLSAELVGREACGNALVRVTVQSAAFARAWAEMWDESATQADPPAAPYRRLTGFLHTSYAEDDAAALAAAMAAPADPQDTHPTLAQRLAALGCPSELPPPLRNSAAADLLGGVCDDLAQALESTWYAEAAPHWREAFEERRREERERAGLAALVAAGDASREQLYRHALLVERIEGPAAAAAAYQTVLERAPEALEARYRLGDMRLALNDARGIDDLTSAGEAEWSVAPYAYARISAFLADSGRLDEAETYRKRAAEAEETYARMDAETRSVGQDAVIERLHLDAEQQGAIAHAVKSMGGVRELHLASRLLPLAQRRQLLFVFRPDNPAEAHEILDGLMEVMLQYGDALGVQDSQAHAWLARRIKAVPGTRLVPR